MNKGERRAELEEQYPNVLSIPELSWSLAHYPTLEEAARVLKNTQVLSDNPITLDDLVDELKGILLRTIPPYVDVPDRLGKERFQMRPCLQALVCLFSDVDFGANVFFDSPYYRTEEYARQRFIEISVAYPKLPESLVPLVVSYGRAYSPDRALHAACEQLHVCHFGKKNVANTIVETLTKELAYIGTTGNLCQRGTRKYFRICRLASAYLGQTIEELFPKDRYKHDCRDMVEQEEKKKTFRKHSQLRGAAKEIAQPDVSASDSPARPTGHLHTHPELLKALQDGIEVVLPSGTTPDRFNRFLAGELPAVVDPRKITPELMAVQMMINKLRSEHGQRGISFDELRQFNNNGVLTLKPA